MPVLREDGNGNRVEQRFEKGFAFAQLGFGALARRDVEADGEHPGWAVLHGVGGQLNEVMLAMRRRQAVELQFHLPRGPVACHGGDRCQIAFERRGRQQLRFGQHGPRVVADDAHHRRRRSIHVASPARRVVPNDGRMQIAHRHAVLVFAFYPRVFHAV